MEMEGIETEPRLGQSGDEVTSNESSTSTTTSTMPSANTTPSPRISPQPISDTFPLFPRLALEIRRLIWTASLPRPRGINLATPLPLHKKGAQHRYPVALHTNRESRQVVLAHYIILCHYVQNRLLWTSSAVLPLCFDPVRDSLLVHIKPLFYSELKDVARVLLQRCPELFGMVRRLKIVIFPQNGYALSTVWSHGMADVLAGRDLLVGMLRYVRGLERVEIYARCEYIEMEWEGNLFDAWSTRWEMGAYRVHVRDFFEALQWEDPAYRIPEIELQGLFIGDDF